MYPKAGQSNIDFINHWFNIHTKKQASIQKDFGYLLRFSDDNSLLITVNGWFVKSNVSLQSDIIEPARHNSFRQ